MSAAASSRPSSMATGPCAEGAARPADAGCLRWVLKRNCSVTPRQLAGVYVSLCVVSLGIATWFWAQGAVLVMPFAGVELLGIGWALLVYARHATDRECVVLTDGRLSVERWVAGRVDRVEFAAAWVRLAVRPPGAMLELRGEGRSVVIGRHVCPQHRDALAHELRAALDRASRLTWHGAGVGDRV